MTSAPADATTCCTRSLGDLPMRFVDDGPRDAHPVVMVHGNPTWSYYYRHLIAALRDDHRCIAPDHIGMGLSVKPSDQTYPYTLKRRIDDLEGLIDHLDLREPITLVVHDWGGMIGFGWAVRHPERVRRLVVLNTAAFGLPKGQRFPWQLSLCRSPLGPLLVRGFNLFCRHAAKHCVTRRPLPPEVRAAYLKPYDSWRHRIGVLRFVQDIPLSERDRSWPVMQEIASSLDKLRDKPMLIGWGMRDFVFTPAFLDEWVARFPDAAVHRYDDAGHYILEDAGEQIIPLIRAFIAETAHEAAPACPTP